MADTAVQIRIGANVEDLRNATREASSHVDAWRRMRTRRGPCLR